MCDEKGNIIDSFNERIKTTHRIDADASKVHGIYAKDLKDCRGEIDVLTDFCCWMKQQEVDVVLTYNGEAFDRPMLQCRIEFLKIPFDYFDKKKFPGLDAKELVFTAKKQKLFGLDELGRKWKLTLVAEKLGFSTLNAHDALADVMMLKNVFFKLDPILHPEHWNSSENSLF